MRRLLIPVLLALTFSATPSIALAATTAEQLVLLAKAGLDDDILIALIETDGSVFRLTADDILDLHAKGLSSRVIRAMQATGRPKPAHVEHGTYDGTEAPPLAQSARPRASAPQATAPVNVTQTVTQHVEVPREPAQVIHVPVAVPVYVVAPVQKKPEPPVYWGWGGQRRPDSWDDGATVRPNKN